MKIINNATQTVRFGNIPISNAFHNHCGDWFMKCESVMCEEYNEPINAVNLETGEFEHFMPGDEVFHVNGKFIAEGFCVNT